ncbi:hypothetical protein [Streptomyces acidiscabies]|uniref:hypothetical protein n=1 Tax=Streptomyces acidiscabies TaxID=42234 RepID=UPI0038F6F9B0
MAFIRNRKQAGGDISYVVCWRAGGARGGKNESEIFSDSDAAKKFKDLVNGFGQEWPPGWIRGQGFVADLRSAEEMFEPFALKHISLLTGIQGDTRARYRKMVERNMSPWFKNFSVRDGEGGISREMVQRWVNDLAEGKAAPLDPVDHRPRTKYKPKTVGDQHGLLHAILQAVVDAEPQLRATALPHRPDAGPKGVSSGHDGVVRRAPRPRRPPPSRSCVRPTAPPERLRGAILDQVQ